MGRLTANDSVPVLALGSSASVWAKRPGHWAPSLREDRLSTIQGSYNSTALCGGVSATCHKVRVSKADVRGMGGKSRNCVRFAHMRNVWVWSHPASAGVGGVRQGHASPNVRRIDECCIVYTMSCFQVAIIVPQNLCIFVRRQHMIAREWTIRAT